MNIYQNQKVERADSIECIEEFDKIETVMKSCFI